MTELSPALRAGLARLNAPDPLERLEAIKALELLGDANALPGLAEIFATDPEPEVRERAQKAGKTIYYGALRRRLETHEASDEERRQAAEILARAQARKTQTHDMLKK